MQELVIEAGRAERHYWRDLWRYRELFYFLAWRDILVRYKQTAIGVAWAVLRPLLSMLIFAEIFGKIANLDSEGVPYKLYVFVAMVPWQFFANALTESSNCLIGSSNLISKIYFPRFIIPASSVITSFVDFLITAALLFLMMIWYRFVPSWHLLFLPVFIVMGFAAALGAGLWLAALTVKYRDFRYIVPFIVQLGVLVSPVAYKSSLVSGRWHKFYALNPMVGVIDGFRWSLLSGHSLHTGHGTHVGLPHKEILLCFAVTTFLLLSGIWYFRRTEKGFADII